MKPTKPSEVDFRKFHEKGKPRKANQDGQEQTRESFRWWERDSNSDKGKEAATSISMVLDMLAKNQDMRIKQQLISARLYGNMLIMGLNGLSFSKLSAIHPALKERISYNVVQSAIDTVVSKTTKNKPKPFYLTSGGDYKAQRKCKKLNQFIEGVFFIQKAYLWGERAMRDGCVWGDGFTHVFIKNGKIQFERVIPQEIWVDDLEAFYGEPCNMHRAKNVDRDCVIADYPKFRKEIEKCPAAKPDTTGSSGTVSDLVTLRESWHLPSGPDTHDGRHVISLDNCVLWSEEWEDPWFPFARFTWWERVFGFFGQGLAEQIQNIQLEINKLLNIIQRSYHLGGTFKVLLENGSKIVKEHINNDIGALIMYHGTKPEYVIPPLVPPEIYGHLKTLKDAAYEQAGISQLSATSQKPEGLDSGKALRVFNDIESERFISVGHAYERYYLELGFLAVQMAKKISKQTGKGYSVKVPGKRFLLTVDWKDIDFDEDAYIMQVFPISSLPNDPSGRLQTIQEYIQAGFLTPREGKRLLNFPDLELVEGLQNAAEDYITEILDRIVDDGEITQPEALDDLVLAREMALEYYQRGRCKGWSLPS